MQQREKRRGLCVGIVNRSTEYLIATKDGIISCSTVRRLPDNEAYDKKCIEEIDIKYADYVKTGFWTALIAVRFTPTSNEIAPDPHPIPTTCVPRAAYSKPKELTIHGYTGGCKGCEYLATSTGSRKSHSVEHRLRMKSFYPTMKKGNNDFVKRLNAWNVGWQDKFLRKPR